jgi:hypothetical protein
LSSTLGLTAANARGAQLFDEETQAPTHLINGVQPYGGDHYTFTLIQEVAGKARRP